jgi:DNA-directed RNA polymerase subunit beta'
LGRVVLEDLYDPITGDILAKAGEEIDEEAAARIDESGIEMVRIRSVLTCESKRGACVKCYGRNLATGKMVDLGEAVGVIAAQSIGEPGTQLTLRTFHIGGTAARIEEQSKVTAKSEGVMQYKDIKSVTKKDGNVVVLGREGEISLVDQENRVRARYKVPYAATLRVKNEQPVEKDQVLFEWDPYTNTILSDRSGEVGFVDIIENESFREELDETTGLRQRVVVEQRDKLLRPQMMVLDEKGKKLCQYAIPTGAHLLVHDGEKIGAGDALVKIPREISKTRDITGGLPRVAELFEARKPKDPAVVSEIDGIVEFGKIIRGSTQILVKGYGGETREYLIPHGKHLRVHDGDKIKAGGRLCEGPIDPHDILRIKGVNDVQEYLVNEIQEVYRLQGVKINDKHIEVIVRQMLQKVKVEEIGDTNFLEGEQVDKNKFREENEKVIAEGGEPATFQPLLLGITKASLSTESFISAASFQETTRVLTEASINGKTDYLLGLKENVIIGHLVPAGTGLEKYRSIHVKEGKGEEVKEKMEIFEESA